LFIVEVRRPDPLRFGEVTCVVDEFDRAAVEMVVVEETLGA